jgi:hypothetical protein
MSFRPAIAEKSLVSPVAEILPAEPLPLLLLPPLVELPVDGLDELDELLHPAITRPTAQAATGSATKAFRPAPRDAGIITPHL